MRKFILIAGAATAALAAPAVAGGPKGSGIGTEALGGTSRLLGGASDCLCETVGNAGSVAKSVAGAASKVRKKGSPSGLKLGAVVGGAGNAAASIGRAGKSGISGHGVGLSGALKAGTKILVGPGTTAKNKALVTPIGSGAYVRAGKSAKAMVNVAAPVKAKVFANSRTGAKARVETATPVEANVFAHVGTNANAKAQVATPVGAKAAVRAGISTQAKEGGKAALVTAHVHYPGCGH